MVLVVLDDMTDREWAALPRTRRLFNQGMTFPNYVCENPVCLPARASLLTGRASHNTGLSGRELSAQGIEGPTLPMKLKQKGYRTALIGKYLNGSDGRTPAGWDHFDTHMGGATKYVDGVYITDYHREQAVRWLEENRDGPRFLYLGFVSPHAAYIPARRHRNQHRTFSLPRVPALNEDDVSDKPLEVRSRPKVNEQKLRKDARTRLQMLSSVDEAIDAVARALRKQKRLRDTLFIVVSDNGYMLGLHRIESKGVPYDASLRVTMRAMGPGIPQRQTSQRLVAVQDIATTIGRVTGAGLEGTDGRDFRPGKSPDRAHVLVQVFFHRNPKANWIGLRGANYLYVQRPTGEREYYDYTTDPHELKNQLADWLGQAPQLTPQYQALLAAQLRAAVGCKGATCP